MAKRRRSRSTRDSNYITNRRLRSPTLSRSIFPSLTLFEDFRRWEPEVTDDRYPRTFPRTPTFSRKSLVRKRRRDRPMALSRLFGPVLTGMGFTEPSKVIVCARRSIRRQVMFATKRAGRSGQVSPRFNANSMIHCK